MSPLKDFLFEKISTSLLSLFAKYSVAASRGGGGGMGGAFAPPKKLFSAPPQFAPPPEYLKL